MKNTRLLARVGIHAQGLVVLPGDVKVFRYAQDGRRAIGLALFSGGFILGGIPGVRDFHRGWRHGNTLVIAGRGRHHAIAPILGNDRNPVAGQIDGRRSFGNGWWPASPAARRLCGKPRSGKRQRQHRQRRGNRKSQNIL